MGLLYGSAGAHTYLKSGQVASPPPSPRLPQIKFLQPGLCLRENPADTLQNHNTQTTFYICPPPTHELPFPPIPRTQTIFIHTPRKDIFYSGITFCLVLFEFLHSAEYLFTAIANILLGVHFDVCCSGTIYCIAHAQYHQSQDLRMAVVGQHFCCILMDIWLHFSTFWSV